MDSLTQATDNLASALEGLCALAKLAWNSPYRGEEEGEGEGHCYVPLEDALLTAAGPVDAEAREAECEKVGHLHPPHPPRLSGQQRGKGDLARSAISVLHGDVRSQQAKF